MGEGWTDLMVQSDRRKLYRQVCDYIAGMTDDFALKEARRLFDADTELR